MDPNCNHEMSIIGVDDDYIIERCCVCGYLERRKLHWDNDMET